MDLKWSGSWKSSRKQRKQRKYLYNAPLHTRKAFVSATLSKTLRQKYGRRSLPIRTGDEVKIMRGQFKKRTGKITNVNLNKRKVVVAGIENLKKDGSKVPYPVHPSNIQITTLNLEDRKRRKVLERKEIVKEKK